MCRDFLVTTTRNEHQKQHFKKRSIFRSFFPSANEQKKLVCDCVCLARQAPSIFGWKMGSFLFGYFTTSFTQKSTKKSFIAVMWILAQFDKGGWRAWFTRFLVCVSGLWNRLPQCPSSHPPLTCDVDSLILIQRHSCTFKKKVMKSETERLLNTYLSSNELLSDWNGK